MAESREAPSACDTGAGKLGSLRFLVVSLLLVLSSAQQLDTRERELPTNNATVYLQTGDKKTLTLQSNQEYAFEVDATSTWLEGTYSSLVFQLHSQKDNITLRNSSGCGSLECQTSGTSVGLVQLWTSESQSFSFYASVTCGVNCTGGTVSVLAAVVGIRAGDPIPGGCSMTSYIDIDAQVHPTFTTFTTTIKFQDSNLGFSPPDSPSPPICDSPNGPVTQLEYKVYLQCLRVRDFDVENLFSSLEDMLTADDLQSGKPVFATLSYSDIKKVTFESKPGQAVIYNVLAYDKHSKATSAYIPTATYACDFNSDGTYDCTPGFLAVDVIAAVILGLIGLFLCFLAHRFFTVEVFLFSFVIFLFIWYLVLSSATESTHTVLLSSSTGLSLVVAAILFTFWFFSGWYYPLVIFYGAMAGFLVMATILYTPVSTLSTVFQVNYVYALVLVCGSVVFMIPFVAFPALMNILSSSIIGSYAVIYCISVFTYSSLTEIVMKVVKNASIYGFLSTQLDCPLQSLDIILLCVWCFLIVLSMTVQVTLWAMAKKKFERKERERDHFVTTRYNSFPQSPYEQLKEYFEKRKAIALPGDVAGAEGASEREAAEWEPLLSPNSSVTRQTLN